MEVTEVMNMWKEYKKEYNLQGWKFKLSGRMSRSLGNCRRNFSGSLKLITLNKRFVQTEDKMFIVDTMLHEIAHAISPIRQGHNRVWKTNAIKVGCVPFSYQNKSKVIALNLRINRLQPKIVPVINKPKPIVVFKPIPKWVAPKPITQANGDIVKIYLGKLCKRVVSQSGSNTLINWQPVTA